MTLINLTTTLEDVGKRLDVFISNSIEEVSRSQAKNLIIKGQVTSLSHSKISVGQALRIDESFCVDIPEPIELSAEPQDIPIDIVYQDQDIAVINKRQGMVVHPAVGNPKDTLVNAILFAIKDLSSINGVIRPGIVHRLDKNTSGLIVIAKNDKAHNSLAKQIATKTAGRHYIALIDGNIKQDNGIIDKPIDRNPKDRKKMAVIEGGREAITCYNVLERFDNKYSLVEFELKTGRTHQIRVHCKFLNHPIVGDDVYGGSLSFKLQGQLLHSYKLNLIHPTTGEKMEFISPLPDYFFEVLKKLKSSYLNKE